MPAYLNTLAALQNITAVTFFVHLNKRLGQNSDLKSVPRLSLIYGTTRNDPSTSKPIDNRSPGTSKCINAK
jgi:hypothetical protein